MVDYLYYTIYYYIQCKLTSISLYTFKSCCRFRSFTETETGKHPRKCDSILLYMEYIRYIPIKHMIKSKVWFCSYFFSSKHAGFNPKNTHIYFCLDIVDIRYFIIYRQTLLNYGVCFSSVTRIKNIQYSVYVYIWYSFSIFRGIGHCFYIYHKNEKCCFNDEQFSL